MAEASQPSAEDTSKWFCLRAQVKREHIAAAGLRTLALDDVLCPRVRFKRPTPRGAVWFVEALFPGYLFAKFILREHRRAVEGCRGVRGIVRFGETVAPVPEPVIEEIARFMQGQELKVLEPELQPGDPVVVTEGPMRGQAGVVYQLAPGAERVKILLELLGETRPIEVSLSGILRPGRPA